MKYLHDYIKYIIKKIKMSRLQFIKHLLQHNTLHHHIEYHGYLSNHAPHSIIALYHLNTSEQNIQSFYENYSKKLSPLIKTTFTIHENNWKLYWNSNDSSMYTSYLNFFQQQLKHFGTTEQLIQTYFPILIPGILCAATHPLIHIGFACTGKQI
jgi:20S proteasome subunit beta 1